STTRHARSSPWRRSDIVQGISAACQGRQLHGQRRDGDDRDREPAPELRVESDDARPHYWRRQMTAFGGSLSRLAGCLDVRAYCLTSSLAFVTQGSDADAMDTLLGPVALYPDPLLAQVLTSSTSPDQVTKFHTWLGQQKATGSDLQKAAMDAGF